MKDGGSFGHPTTCSKDQWREGGALNFSDPLLISSVLFLLVLAVDECHLLGLVGRDKTLTSVKNPYVKNACSNRFLQKPLALIIYIHISCLASSSLMLVLTSSTSPVRGCKEASMVTSVHISFNKFAVMCRSSLRWMAGYPPAGHDSA